MKPEMRLYEDEGRALASGDNSSFGFIGTAQFGLCKTGQDCTLPLGCSVATNTCAPCMADTECGQIYGNYVCSPQSDCVKVECVNDADCSGKWCNTQTHTCIECRADADCTSFYTACNPTTSTCVECARDEQCASGLFKACSLTTFRCTECTRDEHCQSEYAKKCEVASENCVQCLTNADCPPATPTCDAVFHACM